MICVEDEARVRQENLPIMISSLSVTDFRGFREIHLDGLKRFNVIVGESGSGKTALLESIFLVSGANPGVWMKLRNWRGMSQFIRLMGTKSSYDSLFRDIFFNFQKQKVASMRFTDSRSGVRSVTIGYSGRETGRLSATGEPENAFVVDPVVFHWRLKGKSFRTKITVSPRDGSLNLEGSNEVYPVWFISPAISEGPTVSQMFSDLSQQNRIDPVICAVKSLFPFVQGMTLESIAGELTICVSLEEVSEKLPVGALSSGITKFLFLLIAIANIPGGVILIDEMENGFYYGNLTKLLGTVFSFCVTHNVQMFATTHSYELLQAMLPVMESNDGDFCLLSSKRQEGECIMRVVGDFASAVESNLELRDC